MGARVVTPGFGGVYAICSCGVVVADGDAHALWHARIADVAPLLAAPVTTLDPASGLPVEADRPASEITGEATAATLKARAITALAAGVTYLAIPGPTTVQVAAQVRALTQQMADLTRLTVRTY